MMPGLRTGWLTVAVVCFAAVWSAGCGSGDEADDAPTLSVRMPSKSLEDPLSEQEVATFLEVIETLPGKQVPEFEPLSQVTANDRLRAAQLADIYRQEYRAMFDASRHGERWRKDQQLMQTFDRCGVQPEDFAGLMIRMSCAVAANTISARVDLSAASERANQQLEQIITSINRLDAAPRSVDGRQRRQSLLEAMQELVALSEFSRILTSVPSESRAVIARYRSELVEYLPETGSVEMFERTVESDILPTSFRRVQPQR